MVVGADVRRRGPDSLRCYKPRRRTATLERGGVEDQPQFRLGQGVGTSQGATNAAERRHFCRRVRPWEPPRRQKCRRSVARASSPASWPGVPPGVGPGGETPPRPGRGNNPEAAVRASSANGAASLSPGQRPGNSARHPAAACRAALGCPYRARKSPGGANPRAWPWAEGLRPFGPAVGRFSDLRRGAGRGQIRAVKRANQPGRTRIDRTFCGCSRICPWEQPLAVQ